MPHIRVRGAEKEEVRDFTAGLADELGIIAECPADWFTFEYVETTFFFDGKEDDGLVFIEVLWFDRDSEARDKIAALFTERWKKLFIYFLLWIRTKYLFPRRVIEQNLILCFRRVSNPQPQH